MMQRFAELALSASPRLAQRDAAAIHDVDAVVPDWLAKTAHSGACTDAYLVDLGRRPTRPEQAARGPQDGLLIGYYEQVCTQRGQRVPAGARDRTTRIKDALGAMLRAGLLDTATRGGITLAAAYQGALGHAQASPPRHGDSHPIDTLVVFASMLGDAASVAALLRQGASAAGTDLLGNTALHWAHLMGYADVQRCLYEHGASSAGPQNCFLGTPFDYAVTFGPELPISAYVEENGQRLGLSASQIHARLGFYPLEKSLFAIDALLTLAIHAFSPRGAEQITTGLAQEPVPPGQGTPLTLKKYNDIGWGVCTSNAVGYGTFLGSYTGDIINHLEASIQGPRMTYDFNLFEAPGTHGAQKALGWHLDGFSHGGVVTRCNDGGDSSQSNIMIRSGLRAGRPVVDFYSDRALAAGQQIVYNYGPTFWRKAGIAPVRLTAEHDVFEAQDEEPQAHSCA